MEGGVWRTLSHLEASSCTFSSSTSVVKIQKVSSSYRSVGAQTPLPTVKAELLQCVSRVHIPRRPVRLRQPRELLLAVQRVPYSVSHISNPNPMLAPI